MDRQGINLEIKCQRITPTMGISGISIITERPILSRVRDKNEDRFSSNAEQVGHKPGGKHRTGMSLGQKAEETRRRHCRRR